MSTHAVLADAGVVPTLAALPSQLCAWELPQVPCPNDAGPCLLLHRQAQAPLVLSVDPGLRSLQGLSERMDSLLLLRSTAAPAPGDTDQFIALPLDGGASSLLVAADAGQDLSTSAIAESPTYGTWFVTLSGSVPQDRRLWLATSATSATVVSPSFRAWRMKARGSEVFATAGTATETVGDSLTAAYAAGSSVLFTTPAGEGIVDFAIDDTFVVVLVCSVGRGNACVLRRHSRQSPTVGVELASGLPLKPIAATEAATGGSVLIVGGDVYAIGPRHLIHVPLSGGTVTTLYRGDDFPQYFGTLKPLSLRLRGGELLFGSVCYPDPDAPAYGTIALNPATNSARWLNLEPSFPYADVQLDEGHEAGVPNRAHAYRATRLGVVEFVRP